ncbi:hypothetical protein MANES_12G121900v8 [Manihot esculenta]|uniref:Uncharacterized protein n=1 Tax=Manihot esculenta TaxID=3983 RepID=A0A2C9UX38_MANES|nr:hypothetical protein MANES_12G121900v8 [Manihot esculenta]
MERDLSLPLPHRRSSCLSGCMMSPSCFPVHEEMEYSRIHYSSSSSSKRGRRWRNLIRRLVRDGKSSLYGSKPLSFNYDAVSYSQNFDEGSHYQESCPSRPKFFRDVRWDLQE